MHKCSQTVSCFRFYSHYIQSHLPTSFLTVCLSAGSYRDGRQNERQHPFEWKTQIPLHLEKCWKHLGHNWTSSTTKVRLAIKCLKTNSTSWFIVFCVHFLKQCSRTQTVVPFYLALEVIFTKAPSHWNCLNVRKGMCIVFRPKRHIWC